MSLAQALVALTTIPVFIVPPLLVFSPLISPFSIMKSLTSVYSTSFAPNSSAWRANFAVEWNGLAFPSVGGFQEAATTSLMSRRGDYLLGLFGCYEPRRDAEFVLYRYVPLEGLDFFIIVEQEEVASLLEREAVLLAVLLPELDGALHDLDVRFVVELLPYSRPTAECRA